MFHVTFKLCFGAVTAWEDPAVENRIIQLFSQRNASRSTDKISLYGSAAATSYQLYEQTQFWDVSFGSSTKETTEDAIGKSKKKKEVIEQK